MNVITISTTIGEDRRLVIDLPPDTPTGQVELIIRPAQQSTFANPARETARAKLLAAGALSTAHHAPEGTVPLTPEERQQIGQLPPEARPSEALIHEDRGDY
jgi:hypothetical protein